MTPDSSVVIAAFASWSEQQDAALAALGETRDLIAHVELEVYSVLTRLPQPFRADARTVADYLRDDFPGLRIALPAQARHELLGNLADLSILGGATYDALVAATAKHHSLELVSCDRRAARTYERIGVTVRFL